MPQKTLMNELKENIIQLKDSIKMNQINYDNTIKELNTNHMNKEMNYTNEMKKNTKLISNLKNEVGKLKNQCNNELIDKNNIKSKLKLQNDLFEKERRNQLLQRQEAQSLHSKEIDTYKTKLLNTQKINDLKVLNLNVKTKEYNDLKNKLTSVETELRLATDRCQRLEEEVNKARSAATSAFEASDHAKHGVLAHALKAKQTTIDILQEQLLEQQKGHMYLAKQSSEEARRTEDHHQTICTRLERDFQRALLQAQKGAEAQIERFTSRMTEDQENMRENIFTLKKRHQDEKQRMLMNHQTELKNVSRQLENERKRCRALRRQSNLMQRDLEEAAVGGMMTILNTIEVSDGIAANGISHIVDIGSSSSRSHNNESHESHESHESYEIENNHHGRSSLVTPTLRRANERDQIDSKVQDEQESRQVTDPFTTNLLHDVSSPTITPSLPSSSSSSSSFHSNDGSNIDYYSNQNSISAELYKAKLNHIAYRSKTEQRLRAARREMASARAVEKQLEAQALEYGVVFSPTRFTR